LIRTINQIVFFSKDYGKSCIFFVPTTIIDTIIILVKFKSFSFYCNLIIGMVNMKQIIVVRIDLDMGKGKIAAQVGHACVLGAEHVRKSNPDWFKEWWGGQEKVVVRVSSLKELEEIKEHAFSLNVPCSEVTDAGHTQIEPGTTTCVSLGPAPEDLVDKISGNLKLL